MTSVTFEFASEKKWLRMWEMLNDTAYKFASYGYKAITVWNEDAIEEVRNFCKHHRIGVKEL